MEEKRHKKRALPDTREIRENLGDWRHYKRALGVLIRDVEEDIHKEEVAEERRAFLERSDAKTTRQKKHFKRFLKEQISDPDNWKWDTPSHVRCEYNDCSDVNYRGPCDETRRFVGTNIGVCCTCYDLHSDYDGGLSEILFPQLYNEYEDEFTLEYLEDKRSRERLETPTPMERTVLDKENWKCTSKESTCMLCDKTARTLRFKGTEVRVCPGCWAGGTRVATAVWELVNDWYTSDDHTGSPH